MSRSAKKCQGPGKHLPRCCPGRPRCRWNRAKNRKWQSCNCGTPHYPHRKGSKCGKFACMSHPEHAVLMFESISGLDWTSGNEKT
jgi:hypothetical protein